VIDKINELKYIALQNLSTNLTDEYKAQRKIVNKTTIIENRLYENKMVEDLGINRCNPKIFSNISGNIQQGYSL